MRKIKQLTEKGTKRADKKKETRQRQEMLAKNSPHLTDPTPIHKQKLTSREKDSAAHWNTNDYARSMRNSFLVDKNRVQVTPGSWITKDKK